MSPLAWGQDSNPLGNPKGTTVKQKASGLPLIGKQSRPSQALRNSIAFYPSPTLSWWTNGFVLNPQQPIQVLIEMKPGFVKAIISNSLKWLVMVFEERETVGGYFIFKKA